MEITASQVKELRERTGVGLMDCKKALAESEGDIDKAIQYLREKGLSRAAKKADRSTNEGKVFITSNDDNTQAVIVEINCETDFVANNDDFKALGQTIGQFILGNADVNTTSDLESSSVDGKGYSDFLSEYVLKLGENIQVKQFQRVASGAPVGAYVHMNGKIGVVVNFSGQVDGDLAKDVAMHVAAASPTCVRPEEVDASVLDNEREIMRTQILNEGKPAEIVDKIVEGKISKYYKEVCLLEQAFVKDDKKAVKQVLPSDVTVESFIRYQLG